MEKDPLVSICIAAFNAEAFIQETIQSLLDQSYTRLEIIIVDDGSTDGTAAAISSFQDPRINYFKQENKGAASARNLAYEKSSGSLIKFMDADDLLTPLSIAAQVDRIWDDELAIASSKWGRFYNNDTSSFVLNPEPVWKDETSVDWLVNSLLPGSNMMQPGIFLAHRKVVENAGPWNEKLTLIDDFEYMIRLLLASDRIAFCDSSCLLYRSGIGNSLSGITSRAGFESAALAVELGCKWILREIDDSESRLSCANVYQTWAFNFYPEHPDLVERMEAGIKNCGGSNIRPDGGGLYRALIVLVGWKAAKRIKRMAVGR